MIRTKVWRLSLAFILMFGWLFLTPAYSDDPLSLAAQEIQDLNKNVSNLSYKTEFESLIKIAESKYSDALAAKEAKENALSSYNSAVTTKTIALQEKISAQSAVDGQTVTVDLKLEEKNNAFEAWQIAQINLETAQSQYPAIGQPGLNAFLYDCWTYNNYYNNAPELGCTQGRGQGIPAAMGPWSSIYFNFGSGGPAGLWDDYQIKWTGYIKSTQHWTPQFRTCGDDGMILKINGQTVVNNWWDRGGGCGAPVGYYMENDGWIPIEVWWYENGGGANGQLQWNFGKGWQIINGDWALSTEIPIISSQVLAAQAAETEAENNYTIKSDEYDAEVLILQTLQSNLTQADQNLTQADQNLTFAQTEKDNYSLAYNQFIIDLNNAIDDAWEYYDAQKQREIQIAIAQALVNQPQPTTEPSVEPTPEPSPKPSVKPSPEPTPEQTKPTDPTPEPTPETTPEVTPSPDPTPEISPEPTPEPSPQQTDITVDPTPEPTSDSVVVPDKTDNSPVDAQTANLIADLTNSSTLTKLTPEQKAAVAGALGIKPAEIAIVAEIAKSNPVIAEALKEFGDRANANLNAPMPYTLADATTEVQAEKLLADPIGALTNIDLEKVLNPSEWGKDMTDDQREKAQEVVIPVIIASNIVAAAMTRRI